MGSIMTGNAFNTGKSFFKPMPLTGRQQKDFKFWQSDGVREQPKKREDLQKRLAAHYQSIRNGNGTYYQCTDPKNERTNLWSLNPIPTTLRDKNERKTDKKPAETAFKTNIKIRTEMHQDMAVEFKDKLEIMRSKKQDMNMKASTFTQKRLTAEPIEAHVLARIKEK